ncbi:MAG: type II secretion system protein [Planctomycetota bacterium]|jgi:prepilin-type N-terminal cleavage/methylation domain-containing protein
MDVKSKKSGFTIVELLTVLAIVTMLVGLLFPALNTVRNKTKETKQKAQLTTIGVALTAFRNDYGEYPPSDWGPRPPQNQYCGVQKLAEALLGWDLLGFHPKSAWRADGFDGITPNGPMTYDPPKGRDLDGDGVLDTLNERKGRYLELTTANAFRLGDLYTGPSLTGPLRPDTFVICDVFGVKKITLIPPGPTGKTKVVKAGTPILYYRANTSSKTIEPPANPYERIYNCLDNQALISLRILPDQIRDHRLGDQTNMFQFFYGNPATGVIGYIQDPKITAPAPPWPYRHDSYLLISAGLDGEYGTNDDICNFGN